jgi:CBS domain-containing protein
MSRELKTVDYGDTVLNASKIMVKHKIGSVLVTKNKEIVGVLSDGDILKRVISKHLKPSEVSIENVMSAPVEIIDQETPAEEAANILREKKLKKLLVVKNNKPVGFFSMEDLVKQTAKDQQNKMEGWANGIFEAWNAF